MVNRDLAEGQHRNPDPAGRPEFFTTAYFHTAAGPAEEVRQSGFSDVEVYGVEGPGLWSFSVCETEGGGGPGCMSSPKSVPAGPPDRSGAAWHIDAVFRPGGPARCGSAPATPTACAA